ncbi:hypothetical protein PTW37_04485 [Arthrobacter agilis]|uniref:hypothetical protein n=1 Tax=Arthrobacter agilis TaxID=37921 RepID=UPI002366CFA8|nr:hypothetical protein [Arthrobacter agilis]WDF34190.1 hypothetical protein PTW37_04485 [Arthrobacter agilis]
MAGFISSAIGVGFETVFRGIRQVRPHRPIHPRGLRLDGEVVVHGHGEPSGISWLDRPAAYPVTARVSRSVGLPDGLPDVVGLAVRVHHRADGAPPSTFSDILLSSTGWGFPGRFVLVPRISLSRAPLSTVMPYRGENGPVLLGARTRAPAGLPASLRGVEHAVGGSAWQLSLHFATPTGPWAQFATLTLTLSPDRDEEDLRFDAVLHPLAGAGTYEWSRRVREPSYALARRPPRHS